MNPGELRVPAGIMETARGEMPKTELAAALGIGRITIIRWEKTGARLLHAWALLGWLLLQGELERAAPLHVTLRRLEIMGGNGRRRTSRGRY